VLYTAGAVVHDRQRPDPRPAWFGFHEVFHTPTVAAWACHFIAISVLIHQHQSPSGVGPPARVPGTDRHMKSSRIMVIWAIAVFIVIGGVFVLIAVLVGDDTSSLQEQPSNGAGLIGPSAEHRPAAR
jgi:predicted membrane channel-forming protein YqfA (hemolysin III family)